jgi:hypothetical protein
MCDVPTRTLIYADAWVEELVCALKDDFEIFPKLENI